jgi:glycosyltransferase involved in cell wall biosynthesis
MDVSLITSIYRSSTWLPAYVARVKAVATELQRAGVALEIVIVANDATLAERAILQRLKDDLDNSRTASVIVTYVPRESLYLSWNRGIDLSTGRALGFWNVDDERFVDAILAGVDLIKHGKDLVYFPYEIRETYSLFGSLRVAIKRAGRTRPFDRETFANKMTLDPFFLASRKMHEAVGPFDGRFEISGDFDWCIRALDHGQFVYCDDVVSGVFHLHGDNLSGPFDPLMQVENNIIMLKRGKWENVVPAQPDLMRTRWEAWSDEALHLPSELTEYLWGAGANMRWNAYKRKLVGRYYDRLIRHLPRKIIGHYGLRPFLSRMGIVKTQ